MLNTVKTERWLYVFIFIHVVAWTFAPFLIRLNLPLDAMEGTTWGQQLEWGYDKNPFLNGWLTALAVKISGTSGFAIYLFSQLSVAACFWAVWQLAKKILPALPALMAVLLLEGIQYFNVHAIDFNDNTLELSLWALTILYFYNAIQTSSYKHWALTGLFAGLAMMTKYYTVMLLLPMALFLITESSETRRVFQKTSFYLGIIIFLIIITPHILWLFSHDFIAVDYALNRVTSAPSWLNHVKYPAAFALEQFEVFIPALGLMLILLIGKKPFVTPHSLNRFNKHFLFYLGAGPFLLTLLLSAIFGIKLRAGWGQPLLSLWGIILIAWLMPNITRERFYRFIIIFFSLFAIFIASYTLSLVKSNGPSSANFPGKEIAAVLEKQWHNIYHRPLKYVAGPRWIAGNVALYSTDHPAVFIDWNKKLSPWIDEIKLQREGAIFVWNPSQEKEPSPKEIKARFKHLGEIHTLHFSWLRNKKIPPIEIKVVFLPPE